MHHGSDSVTQTCSYNVNLFLHINIKSSCFLVYCSSLLVEPCNRAYLSLHSKPPYYCLGDLIDCSVQSLVIHGVESSETVRVSYSIYL